MASAMNLIDIDPGTIFEQYNIPDVSEIHKKLQNEIEKKKEELRMMVGERYRDLIMAADTIGEMKSTSGRVGGHIQNIIDSCVSLNDQQLIGFKTAEPARHLVSEENKFFSVVIQIKLLMVLPEAIWTAIDDEDFFVATQLFIFSRHISTGLQLEQHKAVLENLPVARKQFDILSSFFFTIKRVCYKTLEREELTAATASQCLASLMLLENSHIDKQLALLIQLRGKAFLNCLCDDQTHPKVKDKILTSLKILNETIVLMHKCFIQNEVSELLHSISTNEKPPNLEILKSEFEPEVLVFLPDIISKFCPIFNTSDLAPDTIKSSMKSWLQNIEGVAKNQLKFIIDLITSVKTIHDIRERVRELETPENWSTICASLSLPANLDLYQFCYQPLILDCVKSIIRTSWKSSLNRTRVDIEKLLAENDKNVKNYQKYIWEESEGDIPRSLKEALSTKKQSHKLLMKTKGYVPLIVELCDSLDERLEILFSDFSLYLGRSEGVMGLVMTGGGQTPSEAEIQEEETTIAFFKECSREGINGLITEIKSIDQQNSPQNIILLARIQQAISELVPHLKTCLSFTPPRQTTNWSETFNQKAQQTNHTDHWDSVCALLEEESLRFWKLWVDKFHIDTNFEFEPNVDLNVLLREFPNWELQKIEEKDEQENAIQSTIRIPSQPSFFLQQYLHNVCRELNKIVPHTLPKFVIILITEKIIHVLIAHYKKLAANEFVQKNQNAALQYFFDVKFVSLVLVSRENKSLSEQINNLSNEFKTFVDPFDFELFFKYLNGNVKKSGIRMQHELGCIISNNEHLTMIMGGNVAGQMQDKEPNILALSSTANTTAWFPLLPIVSAGSEGDSVMAHKLESSEKTPSSSKHKKSLDALKGNASASSLSAATQNMKTGAAAFFGAMSQDWFK